MKIVFSAAAAFAAAIAAPAIAQPTESRNVMIRDLDLSTIEGQQTLDRRMNSAARDICRADPVTGTRIPTPEARTCVADTVARSKTRAAAILKARRAAGA